MRRLLAHRNARLYLAGQGLSTLGDTALWLAAGVWVKSLTGSSSAAGLAFFAFTLPQFAAPLAGLLVDRVRRRPLLVATNLLTGGMVLLLLLVHDRGDVWIVYVVMVLYGAANAVLGSGQTALLPAMLPDEVLPDANAALQTIGQGLRLVSPLVGAGLFAWRGGGTVAVLDAATFAVAAAALLAVRVDEPEPAPGEGRWVAEVVAGLRHVRTTPVLLQMVVAIVLAMLLFGFAETIVFAVVDQGLHRPPTFVHLQGRVSSAVSLLAGVPQTLSIALGAALVAAVDYRLLLIASGALTALAAGYMLTRPERVAELRAGQPVRESPPEQPGIDPG